MFSGLERGGRERKESQRDTELSRRTSILEGIWSHHYPGILEELGIEPQGDREAEGLFSVLADTLAGPTTLQDRWGLIRDLIHDSAVSIVGRAPMDEEGLMEHVSTLERHRKEGGVIIAADGAASDLVRQGLLPDIICTDLDGPREDLMAASREGCMLVVHAHGDNIPLIEDMVPELAIWVGTSQAPPSTPPLRCPGGFTDGDRGVFMALGVGARSVTLHRFDFETPAVPGPGSPHYNSLPQDADRYLERKRIKLRWARRLIDACASGLGITIVEQGS